MTGEGGGGGAGGGGAGRAAAGDGGTGLRGGMAAGRGCGAAGGAAGLAVSSSAMIRRMEARISSIDGSCAFAGWLIAEFPQNLVLRRLNPDVRGESPAHSILTRIVPSMARQRAN